VIEFFRYSRSYPIVTSRPLVWVSCVDGSDCHWFCVM
jgi:hypothetical protein